MSSEWKSEEEQINETLKFEIREFVAIGLSSHAEGSPQLGDTNITIYKWNETSELIAVTTYRTCSEYRDASGIENGSTHALDWNLADAQGAVRDVVQYSDDATTPVNHLVYDSFGQLYSQSRDEAANLSSLAFDGMLPGAAAATLNYDDYRWYDAVDGVFASQDPIGFGGGQSNTEAFVGNSPTNFTDPLGLCDCGCPSQSNPYSPVGLEDFGGSGGYVPVLLQVQPAPATESSGFVGDTTKKLNGNPDAAKLLKAFQDAGGTVLEDTTTFSRGGYTPGSHPTIRLNPNKIDADSPAESVLLFELIRHEHQSSQKDLENKAKSRPKSDVNKAEFATESEKLAFKHIQEHRKICQGAIKNQQWPKTTDRYTDDEYSTEDKYLATAKENGHYGQLELIYDRLTSQSKSQK
jgi:RHS repeat-associated protein